MKQWLVPFWFFPCHKCFSQDIELNKHAYFEVTNLLPILISPYHVSMECNVHSTPLPFKTIPYKKPWIFKRIRRREWRYTRLHALNVHGEVERITYFIISEERHCFCTVSSALSTIVTWKQVLALKIEHWSNACMHTHNVPAPFGAKLPIG